MSAVAGAAMVLGGSGLSNLWDYNRSNYMFDVPLMQNKAFQIQNISMSRLAVFREDVRDLASLTIDKVQSYLIVNTLKLGFIVTIFFNFNRTATELEVKNYVEAEVDILLGACFCCAFFWLLTSIWCCMHAVIVAQSVTTKFLLQVARLPAPNSADAGHVFSSSRSFSEPRFSAHCEPPAAVPMNSSARSVGTSSTKWRPRIEERDLEAAAPWDLRLGRGPPSVRSQQEVILISDLLEGGGAETLATCTGEPHLKMLNMLRSNWSAFDLYGRISMVLGTVNLLMGLAFYCLYYFRTVSGPFGVEPAGWLAFATFSVLAWWCVLFEMSMSCAKSILVATVMLGSSLCIVLVGINERNFSGGFEENLWVFLLVPGLTGFWELGLCWSGVSWGSKWPTLWRCSLFLNPLYLETGPPQYDADVWGHHHVGERPLGTDVGGARGATAATSLLTCLDAVLRCAPIAKADMGVVQRTRDTLHELCRAAGVYTDGGHPVEGFWLKMSHCKGKVCWIDPAPSAAAAPAPQASQVSLEVLLLAARRASCDLQRRASSWTRHDVDQLASSGGYRVESPCDFVAQFQPAGSTAKYPMGQKASLMYVGGCALTSLLWASVLSYSCHMFLQESISPSIV